MTKQALRRVRVRVPCSTSNLGAGFDCIGLALDRRLTAEFVPCAGAELSIERRGTAEAIDARQDALCDQFTRELERLGHDAPAGRLIVHSDIPLGRGLGSSAAAVVAGLVLAHAAAGEDSPDPLPLLPMAEAREGHPDNVAPALFGGLVAVARDAQGQPHAFRLPLSDRIGFAYAAPDFEVPTPLARRALPEQVAHELAARALGRTAALVQGLASADPVLLRIGFTDELHVPFRAALIPGAEAAFDAARHAGAWAVTISGSGSGLIAVCPRAREDDVAAAMAGALQDASARGPAIAFATRPDVHGATLLPED